jgi:hypothetical protein
MRIRTGPATGLVALLFLLGACSGDDADSAAVATTTTTTVVPIVEETNDDDQASTADDAPASAAFVDTGFCAVQTRVAELDQQLRGADAATLAEVYPQIIAEMQSNDVPAAIANDYATLVANYTAFSQAAIDAGLGNDEALETPELETLLFANDFLSASTNVWNFESANC